MMLYLYAYLLPLVLLGLASGLIYWQVRQWRDFQQDEPAAEELEFHRRQLRRRTQTSFLLGLLAVGLWAGQLIPSREHPNLFVVFWLGMLLLLAWIVLLALGDLLVGRQHVARLRHDRRIAEARLTAELNRLRTKIPTADDGNEQPAPQQQ